MKKHAILMMACAAALFSSCGTRILMTEAVPAKVDLGRGSYISVYVDIADSDISYRREEILRAQLENSLKNKIRKDAYYTVDDKKYCAVDAEGNGYGITILRISDIVFDEHYGKMKATATAGIQIPHCWNEEYNQDFQLFIPCSGDGTCYPEKKFDILAEMVLEDLTPHEEGYYVRVKGSSKNPAIKKAALCMQAGDWKQGAQYAMEAVKNGPQDPEAYYVCGLAKRHEMEYGQSTAYFEKAFSLKPKGKYRAAISKNRQLQVNDGYVRKQLTGE